MSLGPITLGHYLSLGGMLFALSVVGIFMNRRNLIVLLMAIELMLLAVNLNFVAFSHYLGDMAGQVFVFFILTVAPATIAMPRTDRVTMAEFKKLLAASDVVVIRNVSRSAFMESRKETREEDHHVFRSTAILNGSGYLIEFRQESLCSYS